MIRLIAILVVAGLVAAGVAWLADLQGDMLLTANGYEIRTTIGMAAGAVLALVVVAVLAQRILAAFLYAPSWFGAWNSARRARQGYRALSQGLVAASAGDAIEARRFARRAEKLLGAPPLALLLRAQAAQLDGDEKKQTAAYRAMLDYPDTEFLGLRGLFMQASRDGNDEEALHYAARAHALKPKAAWAANALFDLKSAHGQWREAQNALAKAVRAKLLDSGIARRRRAVLLAAEALEADRDGDGARALACALEALALSPGLPPAATLAARRLSAMGRAWKAQDVIEAAWAQAPHPDLAAAYAAIRPDEDAKTRAKRLGGLAQLNPGHFESLLLEAEQAIALHRWPEAREALAPLAHGFATARVCALMAEIAEEERGDVAAAHGWLARAVRAPRDAQWSCGNCGWMSADWTAVCPGCGAFDSLAWTTPGAGMIEKLAPGEAAAAAAGAAPASSVTIEGRERRPAAAPRPAATLRDEVVLPRPPDDPGPAEEEDDHFDLDAAETPETALRLRRGGTG